MVLEIHWIGILMLLFAGAAIGFICAAFCMKADFKHRRGIFSELSTDAEDDLLCWYYQDAISPEACGKLLDMESCGKECDGWTPVPF